MSDNIVKKPYLRDYLNCHRADFFCNFTQLDRLRPKKIVVRPLNDHY